MPRITWTALLLAVLAGATAAGEAKPKAKAPEDTLKPDAADEAYGPHAANVFDLWRPKTEQTVPLVLFIHGGGFNSGTKHIKHYAFLRELRDACLKNGIAFASIEYRLTQVAKYPAQMHDGARALQYIRQHAAKWNIDPKRIAAAGSSAGSGIAAWLGFHDDLADPKADDPVLRQSTRVTCLLLRNNQCSYDPRAIKQIVPGDAYKAPFLRELHGVAAEFDFEKDTIDAALDTALKDCSPVHHLSKDDPPVHQMHYRANQKDGDIHHANFGRHLEAEMKKLEIECVSRLEAGTWPGYYEDAIGFLKRQFDAQK